MRTEIQEKGFTLIVENVSNITKEEIINKIIDTQIASSEDLKLFFDLTQWKLFLATGKNFKWAMFNKTITIG